MANKRDQKPFFTGPSLPRNISSDGAGSINPRIQEIEERLPSASIDSHIKRILKGEKK